MSSVHKCVLFCSWGDQGVGLCQTYLPLSRGMGCPSGASLSRETGVGGSLWQRPTPDKSMTVAVTHPTGMHYYFKFCSQASLVIYPHRETNTLLPTDTCRLM